VRKRQWHHCLVGALAAIPTAAEAHSPFEGANTFHTGLLHPIVVPSETIVLVALGLFLGASGAARSRMGIVYLASGLLAAMVASEWISVPPDWTTTALLVLALMMASLVAAQVTPPIAITGFAAFATGAVTALDAASQEYGVDLLLAGIATAVAATAVTTVVASIVVDARQQWLRIATRVVGSWIAAASLMYLAWYVTARA
jgi:urease accessory protein